MVEKLDRFAMMFAIPEVRSELAQNDNLTSEQVQRILDDSPSEETMNALAESSKLTENQFHSFLRNRNHELSQNPNLTSKQIDLVMAPGDRGSHLLRGLAQSGKLNDRQFKEIYHDGHQAYLSDNPHLTEDQIDTLYKDGAVDRDYLAQNSKLTEEQFERLWGGDKGYVKKPDMKVSGDGHQAYLSDNPHLTEDQIDRLMKHKDVDKHGVARYPKLTDKQFNLLYGDSDMKDYLVMNTNITTEQIDLLYSTAGVDKDELAKFSKLTDEQFNRLFNDEDVRKDYLAQNPSINPFPKAEVWSENTGIINWMW